MTINPMKTVNTCRICSSDQLEVVLELEATPPEDQFVSEEFLAVEQKVFPLDVALCNACGYLHLPDLLSPELSYHAYTYETSITLGLAEHYQEHANEITRMFDKNQATLVVDLGSNDGSMLKAFQNNSCNVLGVEPAKAIAQKAADRGIPTLNDFFTHDIVTDIIQSHGLANIITANYMFANIDNVIDFATNVARLLDDNGVFVVLTGYHPEQMKINMFDYIYHEHFSYFTVRVLQTLFLKCGLEIIDTKKTQAKGGSIRIIAQKVSGSRSIHQNVQDIISEEQQSKMHDISTYHEFNNTINHWKNEVRSLCQLWKQQGKKIVGYGASHSTTTLVYHFALDEFLSYQVDDNPIKHGLYSPGQHIPVFSSTKLYEDKPDVVIILAWNYAEPIMKKHQEFIDKGGVVICPLPELKVYGNA